MRRRTPKQRYDLRVGNTSLPAWDRDAGMRTDLSGRLGQHIVVGNTLASRILDVDPQSLKLFASVGIIREARIVERHAGETMFVCVTQACDSRLHLEYGERLLEVRFGKPSLWRCDTEERDYDGRVCVRVRPHADGSTDDMVILTDRRSYRVRLVWNPRKVTIACSWTYDDPITVHESGRPLGLPGDRTARHRREGMAQKARFMLIRLGPPMRAQVMRWAARLERVKARHLQLYKTMHTRSGVPHTWRHPSSIMAAVVARLSSVDSFSEGEVRQWLPVPEDFKAALDAVNTFAERRVRRGAGCGDATPSEEQVVATFPYLSALPETSIVDPEAIEAPPATALRIAWNMGQLAEHAILFCVAAPRHLRRPDAIIVAVRDLRSVERHAAAAGLSTALGDADAVAALIELYNDEATSAGLTPVVRARIVWSLLLVIRTIRRHIRLHDPSDVHGTGRVLPVDPATIKEALSRFHQLAKSVAAELRASRKSRVLKHAGRLRKLEFAADLNLEQVILTNRALKAATEALDDQDSIEIAIPMTIVDGRGRLQPGKQECVWRVWRAEAYLRRLLAGTRDAVERKRLCKQLDRIAAGEAMAPIYEYRRTVGVLGSSPIEPFLVRCWRHGLMALPATLPPGVRRRRLAVLRELKLPGFVKSEQALFLPGPEDMDLWRISLRSNRVIAFPHPMEHGLRFAHLALSTVLENMARTTVVIQQVQDRSGYEVRRINRQPVVGFLAHDKASARADLPDVMSWFRVGPQHLAEQAELVAMTCDRCGHPEGRLPEILHLDGMLWKRPTPEAWVFQFAGKPLHAGTIGRLLRFLLPGQGRVTLHDFRHLLANAAHAAGVPGWMIRRALNHASVDLWLYYAQPSERQNALLEDASIRAVATRSADGRSALASAA